MHVLVLTDRDWTHPQAGGTGTNLYGQVSRWLAWGHRVSVIACGYPGAKEFERIDGLTIHRIGGRSTVFPRAIWRQWRGLIPDADVVLEVINGITFLTPLWLRTPRVAFVHHIHQRHYLEEMGAKGRIAGLVLEELPLRTLYGGVRFMAVSNSAASDLCARGIPAERVDVNYNGVELDAFGPGERAPTPTLLYLGRLKRYKRIEALLDVVEAIPEAVLDVAGDGDHREAIEAEIHARGLERQVRMHGFVDEETKVHLLQRSWVQVLASSAEGWSLSVMEAAACATPTVALDVGGLRESIAHERTGLLAQSVAGLAAETRRLVDDEALRERLGRAAYERAHRFSWDRTAETTLGALREESLAGASGSRRRALASSDTGRAAGLALAAMGANAIALAFTIVFARLLGADGYGALAALVSSFLILSIPGSALQVTVAREVSHSSAAGDPQPLASVGRWLSRLSLLTLVAAAVALPLRDTIATVIGVDTTWAAAAVIPTGFLWLMLCVERGALQGIQQYRLVGWSLVGEAGARLVFGLMLVAGGLDVAGAFLGTALSVTATSVVLGVPLARAVAAGASAHPAAVRRLRELLAGAWLPGVALALIAVLQNVDVIVVKHVADKDAAGAYAAAAVAAKVIVWVAIGLGVYLLPEAARRTRLGRDARPVLVQTLALIAATALPIVLVYALASDLLLGAVFGDDLRSASSALPWLALAMALLASAYLAVQYLLAVGRAAFVWALALGAVLDPVLVQAIGPDLSRVALGVFGIQLFVAVTVLTISFRSASRLAAQQPAQAPA
jgi:glycosyltransferase involved in cell wall biosynthesis/O-antigen/teichoic acid export membrane protein